MTKQQAIQQAKTTLANVVIKVHGPYAKFSCNSWDEQSTEEKRDERVNDAYHEYMKTIQQIESNQKFKTTNMILKSIFPTLFIDGVISLNCEFGNDSYTVEVSKIDPSVVIITGKNALNFLFNAANSVGLPTSWFDQVNVMSNTNGISIQHK